MSNWVKTVTSRSYRIATLMAGSPQSADIPESRCMFMLGPKYASHPTPPRPLFPGLPRQTAVKPSGSCIHITGDGAPVKM